MTTGGQNQYFEAYVPVYDVIPDEWEEARDFSVEHNKKVANAVNVREIGWYLDEEVLTGKQFIPANTSNPPQFRSIFRKVVDTGALVAGVNPPKAHGILFDVNFTLIDLWVAATNSGALVAINMSDPANVTIDTLNINITSPGAFDRSFCVIEYIQEI